MSGLPNVAGGKSSQPPVSFVSDFLHNLAPVAPSVGAGHPTLLMWSSCDYTRHNEPDN